MIKSGDIIKHKAFKDVAILVLFSSKNPESGDLELRGVWLNQGQEKSWVLTSKVHPEGIPVEYVIKGTQVNNWLVCSKPEAKCIRNEEWK